MEVVIGDLVGFVFNNIYTSTALQGRQWKIFQQGKIEGLITFCTVLQVINILRHSRRFFKCAYKALLP
ncbi:hypothetical protein A6590_23780, partial [Escherichia coli]